MNALLVIDIDSTNGWRVDDYHNLEGERKEVASHIVTLLIESRKKRIPIIFIVYPTIVSHLEAQLPLDKNHRRFRIFRRFIKRTFLQNKNFIFADKPCMVCDKTAKTRIPQFLEHRHGNEFEPVFLKHTNDAFSNNLLAPYLRKVGITELTLTGCNTFRCVLATAIGAVKKGFSVTLVKSCAYPQYADDRYEEWLERVKENVPKRKNLSVQIV